jgi:phosphopentomutase
VSRAFLVVIDSVGIGGAPDADRFFNGTVPDTGANTVGHIAAEMNKLGTPLNVPTLDDLGLGAAVRLASGFDAPGLGAEPVGAWGIATEVSPGKDTPSGHWELAGVPVPFEWHVFTEKENSFPQELVDRAAEFCGTTDVLGNCHASGTDIIARLGEEHVNTGKPICYTSADSVFQIAAHEDTIGLQRLYDLCAHMAPVLHEMKVGRVIARPFVGDVGAFQRTSNRKDIAIAPPSPTLCDWVSGAGRKVYGVGKIGDIFSMRGIDEVRKGRDDALMGHLSDLVDEAADGSLAFANFVEFDSEFGHRRNVAGYAAHLEWFSAKLSEILPRLRADDLLVVTADHGNDPTWIGTDHTRERVPVLMYGIGARELGEMSFADVGASVAAHLGVPSLGPGKSVL